MERNMVSDVAKIYALWKEYAAAAIDGDLERWLALWADDCIQMPPGTPQRVGKAQVRRGVKPLFDRYDVRDMFVDTEEVRVLGDRAYIHGAYSFEITPKGGGVTQLVHRVFLDILEKQTDGSWKIAIDCHNYNLTTESNICCSQSIMYGNES